MIRLMQADGDKNFLEQMEKYCSRLTDFEYIGGFTNGENILQKIEEQKPDVFLLGLDLPPQGAFDILKKITDKWGTKKPLIIIFGTTAQDDSVLQQISSLGADYYIFRPVDLYVLESRIRQLLKKQFSNKQKGVTDTQVREICSIHFDKMGIPRHYKGYRYLIEGIWLAIQHPDWLNSVTKNLYPAIGERFNTSSSQVERTMRYALDKTWEKGDVEQLYELFPYEIQKNRGKPTNSAFIAKMVELVSLETG